MAGLIIKLRPRERLLVNGAVLENGDRKAQIRVCTEGANILRLKTRLPEHITQTPLGKAYLAAQAAAAGEKSAAVAGMLIDQALRNYDGAHAHELRVSAISLIKNDEAYNAMRLIGRALEEAEKLSTNQKNRAAG